MTRALDQLDDRQIDGAGPPDGDGGLDTPPPSRRWDDPPVLAALALVLVGVAALAAWLGGTDLPGDDSAEAGFARDMSVHHRQAVVMAEELRGRTTDEVMAAVARDIATTQQGQIGQLRGWLDAWRLNAGGSGPAMAWMGHPTEGRMPGMATPEQLAQLEAARGQDAEELFARLMIPHHQAGVDMAEAILERTDRPEVRDFAETMIDSQRSEIDSLQRWLRTHGLPEATVEPDGQAEEPGGAGEHAGHGTVGGGGEGLLALAGPAGSGALRLGPVALGAAALAWLLTDSQRRWRHWPEDPEPAAPRQPGWRLLAAAGLAASGVVHLALAPEQAEVSTFLGVGFWVAGVAAAVLAGAVLAWPTRPVLAGVLLTAAAVTAAYFLFLLVPPPGAERPTDPEAVGLLTQLAHVAVLLAAVSLWPPATPSAQPSAR
jgi:uncharacterized protein (DUF305 family)